MENIILSGMLKEFVAKHNLERDIPEDQFEKFVNFCLFKTDHYDTFDFDKVGTGKCIGVDGVAISIGGVIVDEMANAEVFTKTDFEAKLLFSQAKTSSSFDLGDFLKFVATVKIFFGNDRESVPDELHKAYDIKNHIYNRSGKFRSGVYPVLEISYVYTGNFDRKNKQIQDQVNGLLMDLKNMRYTFSDVKSNIYDGDDIARLYRETLNNIKKEVPFQRHVALPAIKGARSAYLGVMRCSDYVSMIKKENGEINKGLFFENVRDFLGTDNPVNEDIASTINNPEEHNKFAVLNNGITIVAKKVNPSGDVFEILKFQIVNGCQTSHVLFNNKDNLTDDMYLTVKLIETSDVDLSGKVISTTNNQTHVTKEAFATIRPYHRKLEDFFNAMRDYGYKYFYERRPHQYDDDEDISQNLIATAPSLIQSFISVILEEPHKVHYYYGTLLKEYNKGQSELLFAKDDYPGLYFLAYHIVFRVRNAVKNDRDIKGWRYHLAMMVKSLLAHGLKKDVLISDKKFLEIINDIDSNFDEAFNLASGVLKRQNFGENRFTEEELTEVLKREVLKEKGSKKISFGKKAKSSDMKLSNGRCVGLIDVIDSEKEEVTIKYGPFYLTSKVGQDILLLTKGSRVGFSIQNNEVVSVYSDS